MWPQVLGLSPGAKYEAVQRSYKRALNDAKNDQSRVEKIEAAHNMIIAGNPWQVQQLWHKLMQHRYCTSTFATCECLRTASGQMTCRPCIGAELLAVSS
jgi:hypothetical protein